MKLFCLICSLLYVFALHYFNLSPNIYKIPETECPGDALFNEIKTWPHWVEDPSYTVLLKSVPEIVKEGLKPDPRDGDVVIPNENDKLIEDNSDKKAC